VKRDRAPHNIWPVSHPSRAAACLFAVVFAVSAVAGCGNSDTSDDPDPVTTTSLSPAQVVVAAGVDRKTRSPDGDAVAIVLTGITLSRQDGFDRVVFEYTGTATPGWAVQYIDKAIQNGTGQALLVPGQSLLEVLIREAVSPFDAGAKAYPGPPIVRDPAAKAVLEVHYSTVLRGVTQAFIGLNSFQPDFNVTALSNPTRIVVDIAG